LSFENFKELLIKKKAVKHRGVLVAVKLGHTRIFISIKKNTWYEKCYKYVGFRKQLRADGDPYSFFHTKKIILFSVKSSRCGVC
jgi:hypothetical protein